MRLKNEKEGVLMHFDVNTSYKNSMQRLKKWLKKSTYGILIINYKRILVQKLAVKMFDDKTAIKRSYKRQVGRELDLEIPKRFTEKLQWEKLHYRNPLMTVLVDKIAIRTYLKEKGYGEYLVPIVGTYRSVDEIDFEQLPEKCIFKASHGSSMHLVKKGKISDVKAWKRIMRSWLKMNIYVEGREWPYKDVPPGIICEEFIEAKTSNALKDYKFFCFNGIPEFVQVDVDLLREHRINFYDIEWNLLPIRCQYQNSTKPIERPFNYEKMKKIAADLSKEFPHVRVDFYEYDNQLKIGELTFFDGSGFYSFHPDEYDFIFGEKLKLKEFLS